MMKIWESNGTEEIGLVTPTPGLSNLIGHDPNRNPTLIFKIGCGKNSATNRPRYLISLNIAFSELSIVLKFCTEYVTFPCYE